MSPLVVLLFVGVLMASVVFCSAMCILVYTSCSCMCLLGIQVGCRGMELQQPHLYQATKFSNPVTSCNNSYTCIANIVFFAITDYNTMQG